MIGIIVQLLISWILIWVIEKKSLSVLGFMPSYIRIRDLFFFMLLTGLFSASHYLLRMYFGKEQWQLNPVANISLISEGLWWNLKSVLFEELIFRGVLFYILIKRLGATKAIIISSIAFGIYHWFSLEVLGNPLQMLIVFLTTGIMGAVYALGYARSFSLYIPIGIHLGWNTVRGVIFSDSSIGPQLLIPDGPAPQVNVSFVVYALVVFFPMIGAIAVNGWLLLKRKQPIIKEELRKLQTAGQLHEE